MDSTTICFDFLSTVVYHLKATTCVLGTMWTREAVIGDYLTVTGIENKISDNLFLLRGKHKCAIFNRIYGVYDKM